ncbi:lytic polysaccharide monooxygenase [Parathielavia appendiculata]|uniref:lytic cellulose monooxygenase (C4-dehydrogenating) n=1 Tax=Parathielavia appendiculata TaxID=2587402 RepID=A0AAN6TXH1_9PEZI|nr:lytic polysaccharide monooxygenase [Parathielavia appendiculata]
MKFSLVPLLAYALSVEGHCIFQKVTVNGQDQGSLTGLRAPNNNNPVQNVNSQDIICGQSGSKSQTVINVKGGDRIGAWYQHVIGGAQFSGDPDNPIAKSHKGPIMAYLAKVDNAASASHSGLKWFKIWQDGFDTGSRKWGVDNMINNNGWVYFNLPQCIAPGHYLLRVELLALHSAGKQGQAQFYTSCAQINVSSGGSFSPSQTVSFPGAYTANDPGILVSIYGTTGQPDNGGKPYTVPGPAPISC